MTLQQYFRYWHGYQVVIKPMLPWFDLRQIRTLLNGIYIGLIFAFFVLVLPEHDQLSGAPVLAVSFMLLTDAANADNPFMHTIPLLLGFGGGIVTNRVARHAALPTVFLVALAEASVVAFTDLIYALPLSAMATLFGGLTGFAATDRGRRTDLAPAFVALLLAWGIGYFGTMALRVVASAVLLPDRLQGLRDFYWQLLFRLQGEVGTLPDSRYMLATRMNVQSLVSGPFVIPVAVATAALVALRWIGGSRWRFVPMAAFGLLIAAIPVPWYQLFRNHSVIHFFFTYRWLAFSYCIVVACLLWALAPPQPARSA